MKIYQKGEIATILTIGAFIVISITSLFSSVLLSKKNTNLSYKSKAWESCNCSCGCDNYGGCLPCFDDSSPPQAPPEEPPPYEVPYQEVHFQPSSVNVPSPKIQGPCGCNDQGFDMCTGDPCAPGPNQPPSLNPTVNPSSPRSCSCINGIYQGEDCVPGQWGEPCGINLTLLENLFCQLNPDHSDCRYKEVRTPLTKMTPYDSCIKSGNTPFECASMTEKPEFSTYNLPDEFQLCIKFCKGNPSCEADCEWVDSLKEKGIPNATEAEANCPYGYHSIGLNLYECNLEPKLVVESLPNTCASGDKVILEKSCYACFGLTGEWAPVPGGFCTSDRLTTDNDVLNSSTDPDKRSRFRQVAFDRFINDENISEDDRRVALIAKGLDMFSNAWGKGTTWFSRNIPIFGDPNANYNGSNFEKYLYANLEANAVDPDRQRCGNITTLIYLSKAISCGDAIKEAFGVGLAGGIQKLPFIGGALEPVTDFFIDIGYGDCDALVGNEKAKCKSKKETAKATITLGGEITDAVDTLVGGGKITAEIGSTALNKAGNKLVREAIDEVLEKENPDIIKAWLKLRLGDSLTHVRAQFPENLEAPLTKKTIQTMGEIYDKITDIGPVKKTVDFLTKHTEFKLPPSAYDLVEKAIPKDMPLAVYLSEKFSPALNKVDDLLKPMSFTKKVLEEKIKSEIGKTAVSGMEYAIGETEKTIREKFQPNVNNSPELSGLEKLPSILNNPWYKAFRTVVKYSQKGSKNK